MPSQSPSWPSGPERSLLPWYRLFPGSSVCPGTREWVFLLAGLMLTADYWILYRSTSAACQPGGVCHASHRFGRLMRRVFWGSAVAYGVGLGAAYLSLPLAKAFG